MRVAPLEQDDERPGSDAAHADHFAGGVHDLETLQQPPPVVWQGGPVGAELLADHLVDLIGGQPVGGGPVANGTTTGGWLTIR